MENRTKPILVAVYIVAAMILQLFMLVSSAQTVDPDASFAETFNDSLSGIDIVVVIDNSGTMKTADPELLVVDAVAFLTDIMTMHTRLSEELHDVRIGVTFYGTDLMESVTVPLFTVHGKEDRDSISSRVNAGYTRDQQFTNTPAGLYGALRLFEGEPLERQRFIVLLTDGIDNRAGSYVFPGRAEELRDYTLGELRTLGIPVLTIGFEFTEGDPAYRNSLDDIAASTGAPPPYYISNDDQFILAMFEVYEYITRNVAITLEPASSVKAGIESSNELELEVDITDDHVASANIIYIPPSTIEGIGVHFGGEDVTDDDRVNIIDDIPSYVIINISQPDKGSWRIHISGAPIDDDSGTEATALVILEYDVSVALQMLNPLDERIALYLGDGELYGWLSIDGNPASDPLIYEKVVEATWEIVTDKGDHVLSHASEITYDGFMLDMYSINPPLEAGDYRASLHVEHESFTRESVAPIEFTILPESPPQLTHLQPFSVTSPFISAVLLHFTAELASYRVHYEDAEVIDSSDITLSFEDSGESVLSIYSPSEGEWAVELIGIGQGDVRLEYVYDSRLTIDKTIEGVSREAYDGDVKRIYPYIYASVMIDDTPVLPLLYEDITEAHFEIYDVSRNSIAILEAEYDDGIFYVDLRQFETGIYRAVLYITHENFTMDSEGKPLEFSLPLPPPPEPPRLWALGLLLLVPGIIIPYVTRINRTIMIEGAKGTHTITLNQSSYVILIGSEVAAATNMVEICDPNSTFAGADKIAEIRVSPGNPLFPSLYRLRLKVIASSPEYRIRVNDDTESIWLSSEGTNIVVVSKSGEYESGTGSVEIKADRIMQIDTISGRQVEAETFPYGKRYGKAGLMLICPMLIIGGIVSMILLF